MDESGNKGEEGGDSMESGKEHKAESKEDSRGEDHMYIGETARDRHATRVYEGISRVAEGTPPFPLPPLLPSLFSYLHTLCSPPYSSHSSSSLLLSAVY